MRALVSIEGVEVPGGLSVGHWSGEGPLPEGVEEVELFVAPYDRGRRPIRQGIDAMPRLEVLQLLSAGVEHMRPYVPEGVTLCNARGLHDASTSELAVTLMLAAQRDLPTFVHDQSQARWAPHPTAGLADARVLVVGYGSIGEALERRLEGFEVDVVRVARRARDGVHPLEDLPGLLPQADVVVLLVPATDQTRGMVDEAFLARMRDGALLVNVARGSVVDTAALLAELQSGRLRAALDVTDPEPLPADSPLWQAPGLLLTPHVGGGTAAMAPRARRLVEQQLRRFVAGEPLANVISGDY